MRERPEVITLPDRLPAVRISVIIPSYLREGTLVTTVTAAIRQCTPLDEVIVVDQTPVHEPGTEQLLAELHRRGAMRWIRKKTPSICEAMNFGAAAARGSLLVFLDDDVVPVANLLSTYRELFAQNGAPLSACGQVLQPSDGGPSPDHGDFELAFNFAYSEPAEIVGIIAMNFAVRRDAFIAIGGMDETFRGGAHRCDAEVGFRLVARTGRRTRFIPAARVSHLQAAGGTRAHGHKDSWRALESAVGDHYFGMRSLPPVRSLTHSVRRAARAPVNRRTVRRPWLMISILLREVVAWTIALSRCLAGPALFIRPISEYRDVATLDCDQGMSGTSRATDAGASRAGA